MGLSSNQARFLSLTARQVDLEHRIQQICQRRLRLTSELENIATSYNNSISNRKMFTPSIGNINEISMSGLKQLGYKVINPITKTEAPQSMKPITQLSDSEAIAAGYTVIKDAASFVAQLNSDPSGKYILGADIDLSQVNSSFNTSVISNTFTGTFDGNGYVINNMNINTGGVAGNNIGLFSYIQNPAVIKNVAIENGQINATNSSFVGLLAGVSTGIIENSYSTGSVVAATGGVYDRTGGLLGYNMGTIQDSYSTADVSGRQSVGGLVGVNAGGSAKIINSFATGDVTGTALFLGGLAGASWYDAVVDGCYATGDVTATAGGHSVGGLIGQAGGYNGTEVNTIKNSYATGNVVGNDCVGGFVGYSARTILNENYATGNVVGVATTGGFIGLDDNGNTLSSNYYENNRNDTNGGSVKGIPSTGWNTTSWDSSSTPPSLKNTALQGSISSDRLDKGLRNGTYTLAREADEFSQDTFDIQGEEYEEIDWRATPEIFDELYKGDDVEAENKYDKTVDEINSQDKKLQLEQTTIEVEYKAISSERESVKKILDTNAQSSFKYFS